MAPLHMNFGLLQQTELIKAAVSTRLSAAQRQYKRKFEKNLQQEPTFKAEDYAFEDRPPQATIVSDADDELASRLYS